MEKGHILSELRRLAADNGGRAPGKLAFERITGITEGKWYGIHWPRWNDAVKEAGLVPNQLQGRFESEGIVRKVADLALTLGSVPKNAEMKIKRRSDPDFPNPKTIAAHYGGQSGLVSAIRDYCANDAQYACILPMLPAPLATKNIKSTPFQLDGWVYLLKSGDAYKLGCSENLERRVKQINIALPEAVTLLHAIQTDDPFGIEAYWHGRFADKRLNGEWFKLSTYDVSAFKRRKFM